MLWLLPRMRQRSSQRRDAQSGPGLCSMRVPDPPGGHDRWQGSVLLHEHDMPGRVQGVVRPGFQQGGSDGGTRTLVHRRQPLLHRGGDVTDEEGTEAIIALQAIAGIVEPRERAARQWRRMTPSQRKQTELVYEKFVALPAATEEDAALPRNQP